MKKDTYSSFGWQTQRYNKNFFKSLNLANHEYTDTVGVNDTAMEVRKGKQKGVTILCVFTGEDEDIPAAKKIYGRSMAHINHLNRFADIVGFDAE